PCHRVKSCLPSCWAPCRPPLQNLCAHSMKFPPSSCVALPPCATKRKPPDFQAASWETVGCTAISAPGNYLTIWSSKKWPLVKLKSSTPLLKCLSSSSPSSLPKWKKSSVYPPLQQLLPWQVLLPPAM